MFFRWQIYFKNFVSTLTHVEGKLYRKNPLDTDYLILYSFRWLAVVSWGLSTLSNNTALLITLLYWSFEFQGGEVTFLDFFHHAFQVKILSRSIITYHFLGRDHRVERLREECQIVFLHVLAGEGGSDTRGF
jgi:hypothetical protein